MAWQGDLAVKKTSFPGIYEYLVNTFPPIVITVFFIFYVTLFYFYGHKLGVELNVSDL
jgi:small basic protein